MILTGPKFEEFARSIYGDIWVAMLSRKLRRSKRTIMRWRDSKTGLPLALQQSLIDVLDEQLVILGETRNQLAETFYDQ